MKPVENPHGITTRAALAEHFAAIGYNRGAEIGVERGCYSEVLCQANPNLELLCVDAWESYPGYREHVSTTQLHEMHRETLARLKPYRATVLKQFSVPAAQLVEDGSLDFVYIDANHALPHVIADLAAWVPKVRRGGVVAGHDYRSTKGPSAAVFHVKQAVQAWTSAYAIEPWYVLRGDRSASWLWVQP